MAQTHTLRREGKRRGGGMRLGYPEKAYCMRTGSYNNTGATGSYGANGCLSTPRFQFYK